MEIKLTKIEQQRKERNDAILGVYSKLIAEYPDA
jgi:hypothetical protein